MFHVEKRNLVSLPRIGFFDVLLFLYFFTLHADQLALSLFGFTFRLNNLAALTLFLFFFRTFRKTLFSVDKKFLWGFGALSCVLFLSSVLGLDRGRSLIFFGWYGVTLILYGLLPFLLVTYTSQKRVLTLYLLSFVCVGLYATLQFLLSLGGVWDPFLSQYIGDFAGRPNAFAYEPSYYALYMTPFVMMANLSYLLDREKSFLIFNQLTWPLLFLINLLLVLSSSSALIFAYLAFMLSALFFSGLRKSILKFGVYALLFQAFAFFLVPHFFKDYLLKFFFHGFMDHHSFFERWVGIVNALKIFWRHPLWGVGLGGIPPYLYEAWSLREEAFRFLVSNEVITNSPQPLKFFEPMNVTSELMASCGILGCAAFAFLLITYALRAKKALVNAAELHKHWIFLFLVSTLVMLVVLQFSQGLFRTYVWVHLALGLGLIHNAKEGDLHL